MWFNIDPRDNIPIFIQIKDQIKRAIAGGILQKGDKLPSVRELSKELTVNPNTVSKAYQELENEGIIRKERGIGMFVASNTTEDQQKNEQILQAQFNKVLTQAYHLNISKSRIKELFLEELNSWKDKLE